MSNNGLEALFAGAAGFGLGLGLLKFGNPAILDRLIVPPTSTLEVIFQAWPLAWGYVLQCVVLALGIALGARLTRHALPRLRWWLALPACWLGWQAVAAQGTIAPDLTRATLVYFVFLIVGFYLGLLVLAPARQPRWFFGAILPGFCLMLWTGFEQHFGGLEATRQFIHSQPGWESMPAEHLKRLASDRIFATLLYPNTLAGVLLLFTPPLTVALWRISDVLTIITRMVLVGLLATCSLACLYWSGSKAGWLIALIMILAILFGLPLGRRWKYGLALALVIAGTAGFVVRFSGYLQRRAPSVSARMDYWRAACNAVRENPLTGTGPGSFSAAYRRVKPPEAEMARLAHNDYLEQASDSGIPGGVLYLAIVVGGLAVLYRRCRSDSLLHATWLGLLGWGIQGITEFGLYIPAVGWSAFWFLGWLWGMTGQRGGADGSGAYSCQR